MTKLRVAIVGSGNIGTDLMMKIARSPALELVGMAGIDPESDGLRRARERGVTTSHDGLAALLELVEDIDLAFDATSAGAHAEHARMLAARGIRSVDLTPAAIGPAVVPPVNLYEHRGAREVNLITCGAQATIPIVAAVSAVAPVAYAEAVSTVSSRSAGPGTRQNIDEFTTSTARGLETVGGAGAGKAIIILNPADPPVMMRNTIYLEVAEPDSATIEQAIATAVAGVAEYVPGYRLTSAPLIAEGVVTVMLEVEGAGDNLPAFAGNLDIMTAAAVRVAELYAEAPS
ncbi:MAG: acetaldehyde dehydrogenase [Gaiellales bacterium]|nr:acetaldehyde dehydrogenase [Gaiellales bacterium]